MPDKPETSPPNLPALGLPIDDVLPAIRSGLRTASRLVITAPPGAGKTTRVPLDLMEEDWARCGRIILVEPRRIAARAAAERMAATIKERVGQRIGLRARTDVRVSSESRIEVVTEGVFTRMILSDPALEGVSAVLFDEFHERSLDGDEGLALAQDVQSVLREDLRLVVMSATPPLDLTREVFDAETVRSDGRAFPVETIYLGSDASRRIDDLMASAIRLALQEQTGSILAFLPGAAEIQRTADQLLQLPAGVELHQLFGALSQEAQQAAIAPPGSGVRKIVLATDIAESSLTIEGVRVVIDGGLARVPRYDETLGATRLETIRASIASADQRRGRAGRTQPGACYRLWREAEMQGFDAAPAPEIASADLSGLRLDLARWGAKDPSTLRWLTPPPEGPWRRAGAILERQGALDAAGELTALGRRLSELALPPRLAVMLVKAAEKGAAPLAAEIAALLSERELGGRSTDIDTRLLRMRSEKGARASAMRDLARRWARQAGPQVCPARGGEDAARILAASFPERIARARGDIPGRFLLAGGRGARLEETDPLAREPWLIAADLVGGGADLRITLAARLDAEDLEELGLIETQDKAKYDPASGSIRVRRIRRLGAIVLHEQPLVSPDPLIIEAALLAAVEERGLGILPGSDDLIALIARVDFLGRSFGAPWPADFRRVLMERLAEWLAPVFSGARSLQPATGPTLQMAAIALLDWPLQRELDRLAPIRWRTPAGRDVVIDYAAPGGPTAECRVQEAYGLAQHPVVGANCPLTLSLLSPAARPVAVTRDIPRFWRGGYADMRKDMRGRYPKHDWPEDPARATPVSGARRRPPA